jgi:hypothetical protein
MTAEKFIQYRLHLQERSALRNSTTPRKIYLSRMFTSWKSRHQPCLKIAAPILAHLFIRPQKVSCVTSSAHPEGTGFALIRHNAQRHKFHTETEIIFPETRGEIAGTVKAAVSAEPHP